MNKKVQSIIHTHKKVFLFVSRIILAIVLLFLIFNAIDLKKVFKEIERISLPLYFLVVFGHFVLMIMKAKRWEILSNDIGVNIEYLQSLKAYLIGVAFGTFTPGQLGDLGKVYFVNCRKSDRKRLLSASVIDRIWDLAGLLVFSSISLLYIFSSGISSSIILLVFFSLLVAGGVFFRLVYGPIVGFIIRKFDIDIRRFHILWKKS